MYYKKSIASAEGKDNNSFSIEVPSTGIYKLLVTKNGYNEAWIPLYIENDIKIFITLSKSSPSTTDAKVSFNHMQSRTAKIFELELLFNAVKESHVQKDKWRKLIYKVKKGIANEKDKVLKDELKIMMLGAWLQGANVDTVLIIKFINEIDPLSYLWAFQPMALINAAKISNRGSYINTVIKYNPDRWLRAWLMMFQLPFLAAKNETKKVNEYVTILLRDYKNTDFENIALSYKTK